MNRPAGIGRNAQRDPASRRGLRAHAITVVVAVVSTVVLLGSALAPGLVQRYDLGWSPDPRFTPTVLGWFAPAPRVVPSDAFTVMLGHVLGAGGAQKVVLFAVLFLPALGCAALLRELRPTVGVPAVCLTVLAAQWNPFVAERFALGQWTVLLGYAAVPWALRAAVRARRGGGARSVFVVCGWCAIGGSNSLIMVLAAMIPVLLWPRPAWRAVVAGAVGTVVLGAAWWLPSVFAKPISSAEGARAFAARSDSPLGVFGSLLGGGGIWNQAVLPPERSSLVLALLAAAFLLAGIAAVPFVLRPGWGSATPDRVPDALLASAVVALLVAFAPAIPGVGAIWEFVVTTAPGGGLLRDSQKLLAAWVVVAAVGLGVLLERLHQVRSVRRPVAALLVLPVLLIPSAAWGQQGAIRTSQVPDDVRAAATLLSDAPAGAVGVLPWSQYRRYSWNDGRVSLAVLARMVDQPVIFNDALPLRDQVIPGEDPTAAQVSRAIAAGSTPQDALRAAGVRYIAVEHRSGGAATEPGKAAGRVLVDGPNITVVEVSTQPPAAPPSPWAHRFGWLVSLAGFVGAGVAAVVGLRDRSRRETPEPGL
ncbi:hypothetical protein [Calidifontibacter indicus]|uniref:hypothetical protein n=1 Tax=Calidifontibacter indicus TaxID=419650 RepID=UPI003D724ECD